MPMWFYLLLTVLVIAAFALAILLIAIGDAAHHDKW